MMILVLMLLTVIFVWLVINHPVKEWDITINDKYSHYLKQFKQRKRKG